MRYIAAAALHAKALRVLAIIEEAEERIENNKMLVNMFDYVPKDWRDELSIWPMGKPSAAEQEKTRRKMAATEAAHKRLCRYYDNILSRLIDLR